MPDSGMTIIGYRPDGTPIYGSSITVPGNNPSNSGTVPWWMGSGDPIGGDTTGGAGAYDPAHPSNIPPWGGPQQPSDTSNGNDWWKNLLGGTGGGISLSNILRLLTTAYGLYGATRGSSFHTAPDPLTDAIRARMYGFIDNSPTRNMLGSALQTYMNNSGGPMPMVPNKYGYDPYNGKPPSYDLSGMIPWLQSTMTQPPSNQQPPNYHIDDPTNPVLGMRM